VTPEACPLCGEPRHDGKCDKPQSGKWHCVLCLLDKIRPGPKLPPSILLAAGVSLTDVWCQRCGAPICNEHRANAKRHQRCLEDCRLRTPVELARVKAALETYAPDYMKTGPARCTACRMPTFRRNLCQRHYRAVRNGDLMLTTERLRPVRGVPAVVKWFRLPRSMYPLAKRLAEMEDMAFARWVTELVTREIKSKLKMDPRTVSTVWDPPTK
jgi:hypothetical protein